MTTRNPSRREMLQWLGAGAAATLLPGCTSPSRHPAGGKSGRPPNIVFIMTDDHCVQAMSCYGSRVNRTPQIDRLAQGGLRFDNFFCTNAICAPSRAVILTGKHSHINGQRTNRDTFDGTQQTFPKLLRQAGYQTAVVGKWHLKSDPTGFDYWETLVGQGPYYNPAMVRNGERVEHIGYTTDILCDRAVDWLEHSRDLQRPFLLMWQLNAPHRNWQPSPAHFDDFENIDVPEPPTLFDDGFGRGTAATQQEMTIARHLTDNDLKLVPPKNLTPDQRAAWDAAYERRNAAFRAANLTGDDLVRWKYQRFVKDYLRCVASVDDIVGRLLDYLDRAGLADETIVVYTSDQGWFLGEHGWFDKRWMYEESLRMPLLVRWPGVTQPGSINHNLCQNLDFAETFLDAAGVAVPVDMQGASLVPLLRGRNSGAWRQSVYYHYYEFPAEHMVQRHDGVRTERYKLIHFYRLGEWELYDLQHDPDEMHNVYNDPAYAAIVRELTDELARLRTKYRVTDATDAEVDATLAPRGR